MAGMEKRGFHFGGGVTSGMVGPVTGAATTVTVTPAAGTTRTASEMTSGSNDPPHGHGRRVRPRRDSESSEDEGAIVWSTCCTGSILAPL